MSRLAFAALAFVALAACAPMMPPEQAPGPPSAVSAEDRARLDDARRALARSEAELDAARAVAAPDCARACELADGVCALASRICAIAARYAPSDPVAGLCTDSRQRCERAQTVTHERCACRPPG